MVFHIYYIGIRNWLEKATNLDN